MTDRTLSGMSGLMSGCQKIAGSLLHYVPMDPCLLCATENASLTLPVAFDPRDRVALPAISLVCGECVALLFTSKDEALAARLDTDFEDFGRAEVVAHLHRRAGEPTPLPRVLDALAARRAQGYVPLHEHTGVGEQLGPLWPVEHRVTMTELGLYEPEPHRMWMVRSPWESLSVAEGIRILWRWVEREPFREEEWTSRVTEVLGWSESRARELA